jgi:hypothetical protein
MLWWIGVQVNQEFCWGHCWFWQVISALSTFFFFFGFYKGSSFSFWGFFWTDPLHISAPGNNKVITFECGKLASRWQRPRVFSSTVVLVFPFWISYNVENCLYYVYIYPLILYNEKNMAVSLGCPNCTCFPTRNARVSIFIFICLNPQVVENIYMPYIVVLLKRPRTLLAS